MPKPADVLARARFCGHHLAEEIFSLSQLTPAQLSLALCKLMGLSHWQVNSDGAAITCELNLELMEKYGDFKFVTGSMLEQALSDDDLSTLEYRYPTTWMNRFQAVLVNPLNRNDLIALSPELIAALEKSPLTSGLNTIKSTDLWPQLYEAYVRKQKERALQAKEELAAQQAEAKALAEQVQADNAAAEAAPAAPAAPVEPAATETPVAAPEEGNAEAAEAAEAEELGDVVVDDPVLQEMQAELAAQHRYQGRKLKLHFIRGWDGKDASMLWTYSIMQYQLGVVDDGITDVMRDVIVYEWLDKQSADFKASLGAGACDLERLYQSLELSDIVFLPDGKAVLWYRLKEPLIPGVEGFGVDIDPPFKRNYATGIKHVYMGKLEEHPTLVLYQAMLRHEGLKSIVTGVHYTPADNISPFSLEETSQQMTFINDAYLIFDLPLQVNSTKPSGKLKSIEVLVRYPEGGLNLDEVTARLKQLQEQDLADIEQLNVDIVNTIAEPIIAMKNQQEAKRRAHDPEYASYVFKDPIHRSEFTQARLMRQYPLTIERLILNDHELKFLFPTSLFAFSDKEDDKFQEHNNSLGLIHADAIVVTLTQEGSGLDFSSIDLADCVQIPFGMHQNQDVIAFDDQALTELLSALNTPVGADYHELIAAGRRKVREQRAAAASVNQVGQRAREKTKQTRERLRQARKKKNKKK